jgi:hypothetical protein
MPLHRALSGVLLLALAGPAPLFALKPIWDPVSPAELAEDKPKIEPEAAAEIISYSLEIDDRDKPRRTEIRRTRYKVYDPARSDEITRISTLTYGADQKSHLVAVRMTRPDGTTRELGRNDLLQRKVAEIGHANGILGALLSHDNTNIQQNFLAIPGVVAGAVIDVWESNDHLEAENWTMHSVQREGIPIRHFEYKSHYQANSTEHFHRYAVLNPSGGHLENDEKKSLLTYTAENLPSIYHESYASPESYHSLTLVESYEIGTHLLNQRSGKVPLPDPVPPTLGPWAFYSTEQDYFDADLGYPTRKVKAKAAELIAGAGSEREKGRRIFDFVRDVYQKFHRRADLENWYTRYVESVDELIDLDKIDSTIIRVSDFPYLYIALLRAAGLECHSVFHAYRTSLPFQTNMVSEQYLDFQTVAVKVEGKWELSVPWLNVPYAFGEIPWDVENQPALMAMPRQQVFLNVPSPPPEESKSEISADLTLDETGDLHGDCVLSLTGHRAQELRETLAATDREHWWSVAAEQFQLWNSMATVTTQAVLGFDQPDAPMQIRASIRWPAYATVLPDRLILVPAVFGAGHAPMFNESTRHTSVFFSYPFLDAEHITIHLPTGFSPGPAIQPIASSRAEFSYALTIKPDAALRTLDVDRRFLSRTVNIPVTDYPKARDWLRRVSVADQIELALPQAGKTAP